MQIFIDFVVMATPLVILMSFSKMARYLVCETVLHPLAVSEIFIYEDGTVKISRT